jgi:hypothetical protein
MVNVLGYESNINTQGIIVDTTTPETGTWLNNVVITL